jgi:hypothetical protein
LCSANEQQQTGQYEINKLETTEIEELKFYDYDEVQTFVWLAGFIVSRDWFEEYDLQKFYLKVKSVEALIFI